VAVAGEAVVGTAVVGVGKAEVEAEVAGADRAVVLAFQQGALGNFLRSARDLHN